jgi:hypothetical protein
VDVRIAIPEENVTAPVLNAGLETVTRLNEALIREGKSPTFSQAVKGGVLWKPEPPGLESFDHGAKVAGRGWGDCDDLAPLHAASLRVSGEDPAARAVVYRSGPGRWHAIVERTTGPDQYEDPSQTAGMRVRKSAEPGIPPAVVGAMYSTRGVNGVLRPSACVRQTGAGWQGRCDVPIADTDYAVSVTQKGPGPAPALAGAIRGASLVCGAAELADEDDLDRLWALQGLLSGHSPAECAEVMGVETTKEALTALFGIAPKMGARVAGRPFRGVGHDFGREFSRVQCASVGGFNFKSFLKIVEPLASKAVSFIPGVGPIAATAMDMTESVVQSKSPLEALGKIASSVAKTANLPDVLNTSNYAHAWMVATQNGKIRPPKSTPTRPSPPVPPPAGMAYHPHAVPDTSPRIIRSSILIPPGT